MNRGSSPNSTITADKKQLFNLSKLVSSSVKQTVRSISHLGCFEEPPRGILWKQSINQKAGLINFP